MLMRLAPTMLPTARPGLPCRTASMPTASSGRLVPSATSVKADHDRCHAEVRGERGAAANEQVRPNEQPHKPGHEEQALGMA